LIYASKEGWQSEFAALRDSDSLIGGESLEEPWAATIFPAVSGVSLWQFGLNYVETKSVVEYKRKKRAIATTSNSFTELQSITDAFKQIDYRDNIHTFMTNKRVRLLPHNEVSEPPEIRNSPTTRHIHSISNHVPSTGQL